MNIPPSEYQLLFLWVSRALQSRTDPSVNPDWAGPGCCETAVRLALREGIAPLVHLGQGGWETITPADSRSRLRAASVAAVLRTRLFLEPAFRGALAALRRGGVEAMALKGASLAYSAYPDPSCRSMGDIDLLVRRQELERARAALQESGFTANPEEPDAGHHLRSQFATGLSPIPVELHHALLPGDSPFLMEIDGIWDRSNEGRVAGIRTRILSREDELHLACVHLSYAHRYDRFPLRGLIDVLAITGTFERELDWGLFLSIVGASRTSGAVYWPLELSRRWLAAPIPATVLSRLAPGELVKRLVGVASAPEFIVGRSAPGGESSQVMYRLLVNLSLFSGCPPLDQFRALAGGIFPPARAVGHLPPDVAHSPFRYAALLASPRRLVRGSLAFALLARQAFAGGESSVASSPVSRSQWLCPDVEETSAALAPGAHGKA